MTPFEKYHLENPRIYERFEKIALSKIAAGYKHFGAKRIVEVIRFDTGIAGNDTFKINNNYTADLSRMFEQRNPKHIGFFEKRERKVKQEYQMPAASDFLKEIDTITNSFKQTRLF